MNSDKIKFCISRRLKIVLGEKFRFFIIFWYIPYKTANFKNAKRFLHEIKKKSLNQRFLDLNPKTNFLKFIYFLSKLKIKKAI